MLGLKMAEPAPLRQQDHEHELSQWRRMDAARRGHQHFGPEAEALHELADAGAGLLNPAELPRGGELLDVSRHVPHDLGSRQRLKPSLLLLVRALERRADVVADVADRRQQVRLVVDLDPCGIDRPDALDILRLERRGDEYAGLGHE